MNRNYAYATSNPAKTTFKLNVTPTNPVDSSTTFIVGTAGQGANLGGGNYAAGGIQIIDPSLDYYFKIVNQSNTVAFVSLNIRIFEIA